MRNYIVLVFAVILYCYYSPFFHKVNPVSYSVSLPPDFEGPLEVNDRLDNVEKLHENKIHWPESMAVHHGNIYTGLGDGRIVQISADKVVDICRIGDNCGGQHEEHVCGRPLGMQFDKNGVLYVVDAYHGLFTVDIKSGKKKQIISSSTSVDGKPLTFLNDLTLDEKEGVIYISQSSTKWNISMVVVSIIEHDTSGRLLKYDLKTKQISVLIKDLAFPNGVEMSHDGLSLLVAEGNKHKISKFYINGPNKYQLKELPLILPGEPDNISRNKLGNYWVGINNARSLDSPLLYDRFSEHPFLRKWFLHLHRLSSLPISAVLKLLPFQKTKEIGFELLSGRIVADIPMNHGLIVEFDEKGNIIQSLHSPSGNIARISEILEHGGYLYLGSWRNQYLGRLKM